MDKADFKKARSNYWAALSKYHGIQLSDVHKVAPQEIRAILCQPVLPC